MWLYSHGCHLRPAHNRLYESPRFRDPILVARILLHLPNEIDRRLACIK